MFEDRTRFSRFGWLMALNNHQHHLVDEMIFSLPTNNFRHFIIMHLPIIILKQGLALTLCLFSFYHVRDENRYYSRKCSKNQESFFFSFFSVFTASISTVQAGCWSNSSNSRTFFTGRKMLIILYIFVFFSLQQSSLQWGRAMLNEFRFIQSETSKKIDFYIFKWEI